MAATKPASPSFQFTHPGRGATRGNICLITPTNVSIHAPREGCDRITLQMLLQTHMFQFTHPGRGATGGRYGGVERVGVSIHAPREGCD